MVIVSKNVRERNARIALSILKDLGVDLQEFADFYFNANKSAFEKLLKDEADGK